MREDLMRLLGEIGPSYRESLLLWEKRSERIKSLYQRYVYGRWRDSSDEELSYKLSGSSLLLTVKRLSSGKSVSLSATVTPPADGSYDWSGERPVVIGMHRGISEETLSREGIVVITMDNFSLDIAKDDFSRQGAFYELYPYGSSHREATGVLMAWAWGCSKLLDALFCGLDGELGASAKKAVVTGVSRWGKAALVCGAFDKRFFVTAPVYSGAGGAALFGARSTGIGFDFSELGIDSPYVYGENEPLSCLQSDGERGWFNDEFLSLREDDFPFDQQLLCSLTGGNGRCLYMVAACTGEDWVNAPSMWCCFELTARIFNRLGFENSIACSFHTAGHALIPEDAVRLSELLRTIQDGGRLEGKMLSSPFSGGKNNELIKSMIMGLSSRELLLD